MPSLEDDVNSIGETLFLEELNVYIEYIFLY
jgi:hypothetical protein